MRRLPNSTRHVIRTARHREDRWDAEIVLARTVSVMMTTSPALASTCLMYSLKRSPCLSEVGHRKSVRSSGRGDRQSRQSQPEPTVAALT